MDCSELAIARTVSGGTSPTAVTLRPATTVENADVEPNWATSLPPAGVACAVAIPGGVPVATPGGTALGAFGSVPLGDVAITWVSIKTETEASPSENTKCSTLPVVPGMLCAACMMLRKPGGRLVAF